MKRKAAVIGAGIGGLAAALRLRKAGYDITVFEAADKPGGKINEFHRDGFRFDMGPSLFTLPELVEELFRLYDKSPDAYLKVRKLDLITRYFYEDGVVLNAYGNPDRFAEEAAGKTSDSAEAVHKYLDDARQIYDLTASNFIFKPFGLHTFFTSEFWRAALRIQKLKVGKTMHQLNASYFKDKRLVQLFDRYATYNGSDPYKTPGTLAVISHLEHNAGAYFPEKGMYQIVEGLYTLAKEENIQFNFGERVLQLIRDKRKIRTVQTTQRTQDFDLVVSDADIFTVYRKMIQGVKLPEVQARQERSSSALIFYWGIDATFPKLDLHNILFSDNYQKEFEELFQQKRLPSDPTVYIFISAKAVPGDAPDGRENWFVMINAPTDEGQNWDYEIAEVRKRIIQKINRMLETDIEKHILFEEQLNPKAIERTTGSYKGSLYGNSSNNTFAAFLRHKNETAKFKNLFFVGGSVHPGGGIPLCLSSAKIMHERIEEKQKKP